MNLTRMNSLAVPWVDLFLGVFDQHRANISMADQDVLNLLFTKVIQRNLFLYTMNYAHINYNGVIQL